MSVEPGLIDPNVLVYAWTPTLPNMQRHAPCSTLRETRPLYTFNIDDFKAFPELEVVTP
jgi:hypothetical protein